MSDLELWTRRHRNSQELEAHLDLEASPEDVWRALTEAEELVRWFPLQAWVEPEVGGSVRVSWDGAWEADMRIEVWEPLRHLRTTWPWTHEENVAEGVESSVVVDYFIEARGEGGTRLRLVHSGFPVGEGWDDIFDGTRRGWSYELRSLAHYLEEHRGKERRLWRVHRPMVGSEAQIWERLWSAARIEAAGGARSEEAGRPYSLQLPGGIELAGTILVAIPPTDLGATVVRFERSLLRVAIGHEAGPGKPREVQLWLASWGLGARETQAVGRGLEELLDLVLERPAAASA